MFDAKGRGVVITKLDYIPRDEKLDPIRNTRIERTFHGMQAILERQAHIRKVKRGIKSAKVKGTNR